MPTSRSPSTTGAARTPWSSRTAATSARLVGRPHRDRLGGHHVGCRSAAFRRRVQGVGHRLGPQQVDLADHPAQHALGGDDRCARHTARHEQHGGGVRPACAAERSPRCGSSRSWACMVFSSSSSGSVAVPHAVITWWQRTMATRAARPVHQGVADRVEQQARDLAVPTGADDDELRPRRLVEQRVPGASAGDQALHGDIRVLLPTRRVARRAPPRPGRPRTANRPARPARDR